MSYGTYNCVTKLILIFKILFLYEGTRRYDKSEQIRLIQIHIKYGHESIAGTDHNRYIYLFYRYESTLRYYWTYTCFTDTGVPVGTTGLILIQISRRSYRVSSYAELILITDLLSFGTPVGVTELISIQKYP